MNRPAVAIPEKLFFKIGEVCDLTGVQAHVLRYWESEFPMLAPQKNRAGQRTYRKRDVEMVLRIKDLLYEDQYTIAGAKKKLSSELRGASKLKVVTPEMTTSIPAPVVDASIAAIQPPAAALETFVGIEPTAASFGLHANQDDLKQLEARPQNDGDKRDALRQVAAELRSLLNIMSESNSALDRPLKK